MVGLWTALALLIPLALPAGAAVVEPTPDVLHEGSGSRIVRLDLDEELAHIAVIEHRGESNFIVQTVGADGQAGDLLVNTIGDYDGIRPLDFMSAPAGLRIEADGRWRVLIQPLQAAQEWDGRHAAGSGDAVLLTTSVEPAENLRVVRFTHRGNGNFVVVAYSDAPELLVNEIGPYEGETLLSREVVVVEIQADGPWTFESP